MRVGRHTQRAILRAEHFHLSQVVKTDRGAIRGDKRGQRQPTPVSEVENLRIKAPDGHAR